MLSSVDAHLGYWDLVEMMNYTSHHETDKFINSSRVIRQTILNFLFKHLIRLGYPVTWTPWSPNLNMLDFCLWICKSIIAEVIQSLLN